MPANWLYRVLRAACAWAAAVSPAWIEPPVSTPGGKPVIALPGLTPTLPFTLVTPVLVTVEPPSTPKELNWATAGEGKSSGKMLTAQTAANLSLNLELIFLYQSDNKGNR